MASLALDLSEELLDRLRQRAREDRLTIREVVLAAIEHELVRWEFREDLAARPTTDLGIRAARLIREERARRENGDD
jgi:hypothetical protein